MRIAVMAAGAVGGYFGARLAAAGHDVFFIARGAHRDAILRNGLKIESPHGNLHLKDVKVTDDPNSVGPVDIVLFAVKLWDTEQAGEQSRPLIGAQTRLITLQNGIDAPDTLAPILGADHVVGGSAYIASVISAPGVISHTSQFAQIRYGHSDGRPDATLTAFTKAAKAASIDAAISEDADRDRWQKFVFLVGMSALTSATRLPIGPLREDPDTNALFRAVIQEVFDVGRAKGIALRDDFIETRMKFLATVPYGMKASMAHDLERGNRLELDWLSGKVVALGRELNVPTPANAAIYAILKLHRMGRTEQASS
jgi:2-dehydropantoate 2-reductase